MRQSDLTVRPGTSKQKTHHFELTWVLARLDHIASVIVNADHSID